MLHQSAAAMNSVPARFVEVEVSIPLGDVVDKDDHCIFSLDRYLVLIWKSPPTMKGVDDCRRGFQLMNDRRVARLGYLAIVEPKAGSSMPGEVRTALAAMLKQHQKAIVASAIVFEGTGFGASIV